MKFRFIFIAFVSLTGTVFHSLDALADDQMELDTLINIGALTQAYGEPTIRINLEKGLINLVSALARKNNPEAAELLENLERVTANIYNIDDNASTAMAALNTVSKKLENLGWAPAVTVNEEDEKVRIFVKQAGDVIEGLMVMSVSRKDKSESQNGEAVFLSIVGDIDPLKIAQVANTLDLDIGLPQSSDQEKL